MNPGSFLPTGTVYGVLLNFRAEVGALVAQLKSPHHQAAARAPVLYIKPANTWSPSGAAIALPADVPEVEIGASIAAVLGRDLRAGALPAAALAAVAGYVLVNDLSVPGAGFFRPPLKSKCRDGFLGVGPAPRAAGPDVEPAGFTLQVRVNGELRHSAAFSELLRPTAQLLVEVSEFMTLRAGDLLLLGCDSAAGGRPRAKAGERIDISAPGFFPLVNTLVVEAM